MSAHHPTSTQETPLLSLLLMLSSLAHEHMVDGAFRAGCASAIRFFDRIPFGDHPLKLERYRED
jgi:hypothetical protein